MNNVLIAVVVLVLFVYFGGKNVPDVLKKNKEMLLGFVVGLVASSFMGGNLVEGNDNGGASPASPRGNGKKCVAGMLGNSKGVLLQGRNTGDSCEVNAECKSNLCKSV